MQIVLELEYLTPLLYGRLVTSNPKESENKKNLYLKKFYHDISSKYPFSPIVNFQQYHDKFGRIRPEWSTVYLASFRCNKIPTYWRSPNI